LAIAFIPDLPTSLFSRDLRRLLLRFQYQSFNWRRDLPIANPTFQSQKPGLYSLTGSKKILHN
jgi:hypothetical protein